MPWQSNLPAASAAVRRATTLGLLAVAHDYRNAMIEALQGGYTTGAFYSGLAGVAGSPTVGEIEDTGDGFKVLVGSNVNYALFWEIGHRNLFTRRFEHVPRWIPTLLAQAPALRERFLAVFYATLGDAGATAPSLVMATDVQPGAM